MIYWGFDSKRRHFILWWSCSKYLTVNELKSCYVLSIWWSLRQGMKSCVYYDNCWVMINIIAVGPPLLLYVLEKDLHLCDQVFIPFSFSRSADNIWQCKNNGDKTNLVLIYSNTRKSKFTVLPNSLTDYFWLYE